MSRKTGEEYCTGCEAIARTRYRRSGTSQLQWIERQARARAKLYEAQGDAPEEVYARFAHPPAMLNCGRSCRGLRFTGRSPHRDLRAARAPRVGRRAA